MSHNGSVGMVGQIGHRGIFRTVYSGNRLPVAEVLFNNSDNLIRVEIAGHNDGYVVRYIVFVEIILYVCDARVL